MTYQVREGNTIRFTASGLIVRVFIHEQGLTKEYNMVVGLSSGG